MLVLVRVESQFSRCLASHFHQLLTPVHGVPPGVGISPGEVQKAKWRRRLGFILGASGPGG